MLVKINERIDMNILPIQMIEAIDAGGMTDRETNAQAVINAGWYEYDKYDRTTWPSNQAGARPYLLELDDGTLKVSVFYASPDPDWSYKEMDEDDVVIRYADFEDFKFRVKE